MQETSTESYYKKIFKVGLELKYLDDGKEIKDKHEQWYESQKEILEYSSDCDMGLYKWLANLFSYNVISKEGKTQTACIK